MGLLSGFTMMRNASKLYSPAVESVRSALPLVDEFVVALGRGDPDDDTEERLRAVRDPKMRIIERTWDPRHFRDGAVFAREAGYALGQCKSTWCLYLPADEVLHEQDLFTIREHCRRYRYDFRVEGFLFDYLNFWGDYDHHLDSHGIRRREIRIVRNGIGVFPCLDGASFRKAPNAKLRVIRLPARIYHYGYVRPPALMAIARHVQEAIRAGRDVSIAEASVRAPPAYEYGPLGALPRFGGTHPPVMRGLIQRFDWSDRLDYGKRTFAHLVRHDHERLGCRALSWFERRFTGNRDLMRWSNYKLISPRPPRSAGLGQVVPVPLGGAPPTREGPCGGVPSRAPRSSLGDPSANPGR